MDWATGAKTVQARSLSARRAWIEIYFPWPFLAAELVALRKESVDRNYVISIARMVPRTSLSARRAWIEIDTRFSIEKYRKSLSARRAWIEI